MGGEARPPDPNGLERWNENFPQADAEEGTKIFAVLAGEGSGGGHESKVVGNVSVSKRLMGCLCGPRH